MKKQPYGIKEPMMIASGLEMLKRIETIENRLENLGIGLNSESIISISLRNNEEHKKSLIEIEKRLKKLEKFLTMSGSDYEEEKEQIKLREKIQDVLNNAYWQGCTDGNEGCGLKDVTPDNILVLFYKIK